MIMKEMIGIFLFPTILVIYMACNWRDHIVVLSFIGLALVCGLITGLTGSEGKTRHY